jgi:hypothetical protein
MALVSYDTVTTNAYVCMRCMFNLLLMLSFTQHYEQGTAVLMVVLHNADASDC